ncbi:MAG: Response regulator rcp1 [Elusimicrobia bacterium ADurb.Bin231]|nr:MAG: Response regulator rcp1 [Elusimicrobia bacterium ADurb.Bin231]
MANNTAGKSINILLVEDNPGDVRLTVEALKDCKVNNKVYVAKDGEAALAFLNKKGQYVNMSRPDLILLDWNLPRKNGSEVLAEIKSDNNLKTIPVIVLTSSKAEQDIIKAYDLHANCYITKPVDLNQFLSAINSIEDFWFSIVKLPLR